MKITSPTNPRIKNVVKLRKASERRQSGLMIIEGVRELNCALEVNIKLKEVYVCATSSANIKELGIPKTLETIDVTESVFSKISFGDRNEGFLAIGEVPNLSLRQIQLKKNTTILVVENVEKPGNLGAILRTADGSGVDAVIVCDTQTDLYNPNVIRASIGTIFSVPTVVCSNEEILQFIKDERLNICAATPRAKTIYHKAELNKPLAMIVGSEDKGLSEFWLKNADVKVKIPMCGVADSLNVSNSAAILLFEVMRQKERS